MVNKDHIAKWLREKLITQEQATKMLADVALHKKEQGSNKFIVAISTIGSIFLGVGAILFVAANWEILSHLEKNIILLGSTFGAYAAGYHLKYRKETFPKVGTALIFLSALLFGAALFLIAQMYHTNGNSHWLVLIWLIGTLPLVYAFQSSAIAGLTALLFLIWLGLFLFRGLDFWDAEDFFRFLPVFYVVAGTFLFGFGAFHYSSEHLKGVARTYRLAGIKIAMVALFFLTFRYFSGVLR